MKKLFVLMILVVATISFTFSQESSSSLIKKRNEEIKEIKKQNLPPEEIEKQIKETDDFYLPLIDSTLARESRGNSSNNGSINKPNHQRTVGGTFSTPNFQGGGLSITKTANAYATVVINEAKAEFIKNMGSNQTSNSETSSSGYIGIMTNNFPNYMVDVIVQECDNQGNPIIGGMELKFTLKPGEKMEYSLIPGTWIIVSKAWNSYTSYKPRIIFKNLDPLSFSFYEGKKYYWGSINGF